MTAPEKCSHLRSALGKVRLTMKRIAKQANPIPNNRCLLVIDALLPENNYPTVVLYQPAVNKKTSELIRFLCSLESASLLSLISTAALARCLRLTTALKRRC